MKSVINKASSIVKKVANEYDAANDVYYIEIGVHEDRMNEHPSMENYCEKCIDAAIIDKKRKFFLDRMAEMGKIYEYQQWGFYREPHYTWNKDGTAKGLIIRKIKAKEPKEKVVKYLQNQLRIKFPVKTIFSYRYYSGGEADGFDVCDGCGIIFNQSLLLSDQELEHWEFVTDKDLAECIHDPYHAYQLDKILYEYAEGYKHAERIESLAKRIIHTQSIVKKHV